MVETLFLAIVLLVLAWVAWTYLPPPVGLVIGIVLGLAAAYLLLVAVFAVGDGRDGHELGAALGLKLLRR